MLTENASLMSLLQKSKIAADTQRQGAASTFVCQ
jgi:hypothetical protein